MSDARDSTRQTGRRPDLLGIRRRRNRKPVQAERRQRRQRFESLEARLVLDSTTVFNELMYHPPENSNVPEWIELHNQMSVDMDLSEWTLRGAVDYSFPSGTIMPAGGYLVISASPEQLAQTTGFADSLGPFQGNLSNSGETLELVNHDQRVMDTFTFGDSAPWPVAPDGSGASLAKLRRDAGTADAANWGVSEYVGGTPGDVNFVDDNDMPPVQVSLVPASGAATYHIPLDDSLLDAWQAPAFDDTSWTTGRVRIGYDTETPDVVGGVSNVAVGKPIIARSGEYAALAGFDAQNVTDGSDQDVFSTGEAGSSTYWLGRQGVAQEWFILDLQREFEISEVRLRNTHNTQYNDRGTGAFRILASNQISGNNLVSPATLVTGTLSNVSGQTVISPDVFNQANGLTLTTARYLRFETLTANNPGNHVGLNEIEVYAETGINFVAPPIAYWTFDGDHTDASGNHHDGNAVGTAFSDDVPATLASGQSLQLDGVDDYVSIPLDVSELSYTASMWFKSSSSGRGLFAVVDGDLGVGGHDRHIYFSGSNVATRVWSDETISSSGRNFTNGQWHHLVHVFGGAIGGQKIYVDGEMVASGGKTSSNFDWQQRVNLGFSNDAATDYFMGQIDDVAIWDQALDDTAIQALYQGASPLAVTGYAGLISTDVQEAMKDVNSSLYLRSTFDAVPSIYDQLTLNVRYDDGFVAYLNDVEVARSNAPADPAWNAAALASRPDPLAVQSELIDLAEYLDLLTETNNVLAIQGLNESAADSDFLLNIELQARIAPPVAFESSLVFNEVAAGDAEDFWLELYNAGNEEISLDGVVIAHRGSALEYEFSDVTLASRQRLVVTAGELGFSAAAGDRLFLYAPGKQAVIDGVAVKSLSQARFPDGGPWMNQTSTSAAAANLVALHDEIVINEIMYHRQPQYADASSGAAYQERGEEWIELFNRGQQPVDLGGWRLSSAVDYDFPAGTILNPGEYLVVSDNAAQLLASHPGINAIGNFQGNLSDSGEQIRLLDDLGNPADEVTYYDGGKWPIAADGGGSSLELRDPWADNNRGAAWAASDESERVDWQHFSYSGIVQAPVYDPPINFHEFVMGLLDEGVVLLDNIRVIENPDLMPTHLIQNGSFESDTVGQGADKWRLVGTHENSQVIVDPADPNNHVLRLVAETRSNYLANHAETTLANGARVINGREYEISFDARWVSGSPQLRTELYYNDLAKVTILPTAAVSGAPGAQNSRLEDNIGPTYSGLRHEPVIPDAGQNVTVSVEAEDNDGLGSMTLWYAVNGLVWNSAAMTRQGGSYSGVIPGQASGTVVQFYVQAEDALGASSSFPAEGPNSRALIKFQDGAAQDGPRHNFRYIMTPADVTRLHERNNILSNHRLGTTVVYNEKEVFYDVGARLRGSMFSRNSASRTGYNVQFQPDQLFRGVHDSVTMKTVSKREVLVKHLAVQAGIPGVYDDFVYLMTPSGTGRGVASLSMARHGDIFLESQFDNGREGTLFKMEGIRVMQLDGGAGPEDLKTYHPNIGWMPQFDLADLGNDKELYRWPIQINRNRAEDNYDQIIQMMKTFSLSGAALQQAAEQVLDVDQWMRTFALMSLAGIGDTYSQGNPHNLNFYVRPSDNKVMALPWDWDFTFNRSATSPLWGNKNISKLISLPVNRRLFYGHLYDMINTVYNTQYMAYWTEHYGEIAGESYAGHLSYIGQRANYVSSQLPARVSFRILTQGGADFTVDEDSVALQGKGWIDVREVYLTGREEPLDVAWLDGDTWSITLPLQFGPNPVELQAFGFGGELVGSASVTITSTANEPRLADVLRITEIMYHPSPPGTAELAAGFDDADEFEYVEVRNIGTLPLNLDGVQFTNGVTFTFPNFSLLPGQYALVVEDEAAFAARYPGGGVNLMGQWSGGLGNNGEILTMAGPLGEAVVEIEYGDSGAWPQRADGRGSSLELIDAETSSSDPTNWRASMRLNGSPGRAAAAPLANVVINEVLTHTDPPQLDAIELYNPSDAAVDIGGWYLSDSGDEFRKFQIPAGATIGPRGYRVFDESDFNASAGVDPLDFALDGAHGDEVRLLAPSSDGLLFIDTVDFGGGANGESFGRWPNASGELYPQLAPTLGAANQGPRVGPLVISEVMYHPLSPPNGPAPDDLEFLEILNPTAAAVDLTDWRIRGGVDYDFPPGRILAPGDALVVLSFDPQTAANSTRLADFRAFYGIDDSVNLVGGYAGTLDNGGERVTLQRPDEPPLEEPEFIPRLLEDRVDYDDQNAWPATADGQGDSLTRIDPSLWGMSPGSWTGAAASPGQFTIGPQAVVSVAVNALPADPASLASGPSPSNWATQNSDLQSVTITFRREVLTTIADFQLINLGVNAPVDADTPITLNPDMLTVNSNLVTLHFATEELTAGVYRLEIADTLTDAAGSPLDGDADGVAGGLYQLTGSRQNGLFELAGDWNGDGGVTIFDFPTFAYWFGQSIPQAPDYVDLNHDGGVTIFDFPVFARNFGNSITPPIGLGAAVAGPLLVAEQNSAARVSDLSDERRTVSPADRAAALQVVLTEWSREVWSRRWRELPAQIAPRDPLQAGEQDELLGGDEAALEQLL